MKTPALIPIEQVVSRFLFKYRLDTNDAMIFTEHVCNAYRDFCLYDSDQVVTAKVSVTSNKLIEMPTDMVGFVDLLISTGEGEYWSFTERRNIVNTTTFTGLVEGLDATVGEGVGVNPQRTTGYAAKGAINDYNYTIDWAARRMFVDGAVSQTVVLMYVTSGIEASGTTSVPEFLTPMFDQYLLWKKSYWDGVTVRERQGLERDYTNARLTARNFINSMSYSQWHDVILSSINQAPKR
jgi:hypothetical protein